MSGEMHVHGVGKAYRTWGSEWKRIASWFGAAVRPREEHWVLRDVSFSVLPGQAVGVIGQNGAGKSTLLKIITGTTQPTAGVVHRAGRIAAILELGMGFNPDLTGRENAFHSAGLMGYGEAEIAAAMPAIESFAEIGEYFDQPMRVYSSGMQVRVAFSVATAFRPDLLIVDEALSVGDSYFQHKSFDRIRQFREEGISIMLVTHSMADVKSICDRAILLEKGRVVKDGPPDEVVDFYNALIAQKENASLSIEQRREKNGWMMTRSGTRAMTVDTLRLVDADTGTQVSMARTGQRLRLELDATAHAPIPRAVLGYMLRDKQGTVIWGTNTFHTGDVVSDIAPGETLRFEMEFECSLGPGSYSVSPALVSSDTHMEDNFDWVDNLLVFDVMNADRHVFIGSTWLDVAFSIRRSDTPRSTLTPLTDSQ